MKLSIISLFFSLLLVPFAAVSAGVYKCETIGTFHSKDDAKNPQVPSKAMLDWMGNEMLQTFTISYQTNSDMNMTSERFAKFTMKRERNPNGNDMTNATPVSFMDNMIGKVRGDLGRGWKSYYWSYFSAYVGITCRW
jgi:hypothetical protein